MLFLEEISKIEIELGDIEENKSFVRMQEEWDEKKSEINSKDLLSKDPSKVSWKMQILSKFQNNYCVINKF